MRSIVLSVLVCGLSLYFSCGNANQRAEANEPQSHDVYINTDILNIREKPSKDAAVLDKGKYLQVVELFDGPGTPETVDGLHGEWQRIKFGDTTGYAYSYYLSEFPEQHKDMPYRYPSYKSNYQTEQLDNGYNQGISNEQNVAKDFPDSFFREKGKLSIKTRKGRTVEFDNTVDSAGDLRSAFAVIDAVGKNFLVLGEFLYEGARFYLFNLDTGDKLLVIGSAIAVNRDLSLCLSYGSDRDFGPSGYVLVDLAKIQIIASGTDFCYDARFFDDHTARIFGEVSRSDTVTYYYSKDIVQSNGTWSSNNVKTLVDMTNLERR